MSWTAPMTFVGGAPPTAAQLNTYLRDNLLETAPAKATGEGNLFISQGNNSIAERSFQTMSVADGETTSSTTYTDLTTSGPAVTATTGTEALVILKSRVRNDTTGNSVYMSVAVSGDTTISASDSRALRVANTDGEYSQYSYIFVQTSLNAGSNTFTAKYKVDGGQGRWRARYLTVFPF